MVRLTCQVYKHESAYTWADEMVETKYQALMDRAGQGQVRASHGGSCLLHYYAAGLSCSLCVCHHLRPAACDSSGRRGHLVCEFVMAFPGLLAVATTHGSREGRPENMRGGRTTPSRSGIGLDLIVL